MQPGAMDPLSKRVACAGNPVIHDTRFPCETLAPGGR